MPSPFTSRQAGKASGGNGCFDLWAFFFEAVGANTGFALHARIRVLAPVGLAGTGGVWVPRAGKIRKIPKTTEGAVAHNLLQIRRALIDLRLTEFKTHTLRGIPIVFTIC